MIVLTRICGYDHINNLNNYDSLILFSGRLSRFGVRVQVQRQDGVWWQSCEQNGPEEVHRLLPDSSRAQWTDA